MAYLVYLGIERVKVYEEVDTGFVKCVHAATVVSGGVDVVNAYSIGSELLH